MSTVAFRDPVYPLLTREQCKHRNETSGRWPGDCDTRLDRIYDQGYSIIPAELLDQLVKFIGLDTVFEVGAGCGYLARLLSDRGVNIRAIDSQVGSHTRDEWWDGRPLYFNVEKLDHTAFEEFPGKIVLMTWPCISDFAFEVASKMKRNQFLIYHGEMQGGCTANPKFFQYLRDHFHHLPESDDIDDAGYSEIGQLDFWNVYVKR